jgi:hypothetical protein
MPSSAKAADLLFQPRVETGVMSYSFESEAVSDTSLSLPVPLNTGNNYAQQDFKFSDTLPFVGVGGTLFLKHFFLDVSGQSAFNGQDSATIAYSGYNTESIDYENFYANTAYIAAEPGYQARFDRKEMAISLGHAFGRHFSMFVGYKWAETDFNTTYQGPLSVVSYNSDPDIDGTGGGRVWGEVDYRFKYEGPFIGAVQGWEIGRDRFYGGTLTASLALAYLKGEVELDHKVGYVVLNRVNGIPVPERSREIPNGGVSNRYGTEGDSLGLTFGLGWRGKTKIEGLEYYLGISAYRYEFDAEEGNQSNISEDVLTFKAGLSYAFWDGLVAQEDSHSPNGGHALGWELRPRAETGVMRYSIGMGAYSRSVLTLPNEPSGYNITKPVVKYSDTMSFATAGATLFFNRMFLDLSVRSAYNGEDHTRAPFSVYDEDSGSGDSLFISVDPDCNGRFERTDRAVSAGYAISERLSVFAGYKWDELDLDVTLDGPFSLLKIDNFAVCGRLTSRLDISFKYEGPFVGVTHGWNVDGPAFLKGMVSVSLAMAFLNSELRQDETGTQRANSLNGVEIEPVESTYSKNTVIKGDTTGITLGLNWHGDTWIENLSYSLGMSGYRYQFESDNPDYEDIRETVVTFKFGIDYAF